MSLSCYLWGVYLDYNIILLKGKRMVRKKKRLCFLSLYTNIQQFKY